MNLEICIQRTGELIFKWFTLEETTDNEDLQKMRNAVGKNTFIVDSNFSDYDPESLTNDDILRFNDFIYEEEGNWDKIKAIFGYDSSYSIQDGISLVEDSRTNTKQELIWLHLGLDENGQNEGGNSPNWLNFIAENHVWDDYIICNQVALLAGYQSDKQSTWIIF